MSQLTLAALTLADEPEFLERVQRSRSLHGRWVQPPSTAESFQRYLARSSDENNYAFGVRLGRPTTLVGVININLVIMIGPGQIIDIEFPSTPHSPQGGSLIDGDLSARSRSSAKRHALPRFRMEVRVYA